MVRHDVREDLEDQAVGVHRGVQSSILPAGHSGLSDRLLDAGIQDESNICSGSPGRVADGEVNADPAIPAQR
jgi:hypothetical protein